MKLKFKDFYFGNRPLKDDGELVEMVAKKFKLPKQENAKQLVLFKNPDSQSLLVNIGGKVAKIYDSKTLPRPVINWSIGASDLKNSLDHLEVVSTSKLRFPNKKEKLYKFDKSLFQSKGVKKAIGEIL